MKRMSNEMIRLRERHCTCALFSCESDELTVQKNSLHRYVVQIKEGLALGKSPSNDK